MATDTKTELSEVEAIPRASSITKSKRMSGEVNRRIARGLIFVSNGDLFETNNVKQETPVDRDVRIAAQRLQRLVGRHSDAKQNPSYRKVSACRKRLTPHQPPRSMNSMSHANLKR